ASGASCGAGTSARWRRRGSGATEPENGAGWARALIGTPRGGRAGAGATAARRASGRRSVVRTFVVRVFDTSTHVRSVSRSTPPGVAAVVAAGRAADGAAPTCAARQGAPAPPPTRGSNGCLSCRCPARTLVLTRSTPPRTTDIRPDGPRDAVDPAPG